MATPGGGRGPLPDLPAAEWLTVHEQTESSLSSCELDLTERTITARQRRGLVQRLSDCRADIERLSRALTAYTSNPIKHKIAVGEIDRRRGLVTALRSYADRLEAQAAPVTTGRRRGATGGAARGAVEDTEETVALSNAQLYAAQQQTIARQDEKLDGILAGVQTLKAISTDIHGELDVQSGLLQDVDHGLDHAAAGIDANVRRIGEVERKDRGGWLSVACMLLWLLLIILLLASDAFCPLFALMGSKCDGHNQGGGSNNHSSNGTAAQWGRLS